MSLDALLALVLNGLAGASSLFLVAAGLSLIFGVTRVVNFAHGSLYMLGLYIAWSLSDAFGRGSAVGFWGAVLLAALAVAAIGIVIEVLVLRRIYAAPELFQLLATFAVVLVIKDAALAIWGAEDLLGPRAPGLAHAVELFDRRFPAYDLLLIAAGPVVLVALTLALRRTRWGRLVRAATEDREMTGALGVNQALLFTSVFAVGAFLAGLGGALQLPREPANLGLDIAVVAEAFVVVVAGGMGSIGGAFVAALLIALVKAFCIGLGTVHIGGVALPLPQFTLVAEFAVMALVLAIRPYGLFGKPTPPQRAAPELSASFPLPRPWVVVAVLAALAALPLLGDRFAVVLATDIVIFALFAVSLHLLLGPAGLISFGHAAYFGLGAYGAAMLLKSGGLPMEAALVAAPFVGAVFALAFGWFCIRLSGVYAAMMTLAFAQLAWSVAFQWDSVTGGSNGLIGVWPAQWLGDKSIYFWLTLALCAGAIALLWRLAASPFGYGLRALRDAPLRAEAVGIDRRALQWAVFTVAGGAAALAGGLYAFSKGSIAPDLLAVPRSVDALVMVLLGGVGSLAGPPIGAAALTLGQDELARVVDYWRAALGLAILAIVLLAPGGLAGIGRRR